MRIDVKPVAELTAEERDALKALSTAVYPPEVLATRPGRHIHWASPIHGVLVSTPEGELVSYVGIVVRAGTLDGAPVTIGGVGSVKTHPQAEGHGYATAGLRRAAASLNDDHRVAFSLLVCQDHLVPFYDRLGWRTFRGRLVVEQPTGRIDFTINRPMVLPGLRPAPEDGVHHLEKIVNGLPFRRPPWFFDVRVQGNGLADIPTHLVAQVQRLLRAQGRTPAKSEAELLHARLWSTPVPRAVFTRVTGLADFPAELRDHVDGDALTYFGNADLSFRLGGVSVELTTRWDLSEPPGGGDTHSAIVRGTRADIRVEQGPQTGFRRRLLVEPRRDASRVAAALETAVAGWQADHPGVAVKTAPAGSAGVLEVEIPGRLRTGHESHFPLVLAELLQAIEHESGADARVPPTSDRGHQADERVADTLAKYELLARALASTTAGASR